jgi:hypothetical protein
MTSRNRKKYQRKDTNCKAMNTNRYRRQNIYLTRKPLRTAILLLAASTIATACTLRPATIVDDTVGPGVAAVGEFQQGYLTVYSASIWTTADDLTSSLRSYTDYDIHRVDGSLLKHVVNGDEEPLQVALPAGQYFVVAQSDNAGTVSVPVAIENGQVTIVGLDAFASEERFVGVDPTDLVRLPDGHPIGLRADRVELSGSNARKMAVHSKRPRLAMQPPES